MKIQVLVFILLFSCFNLFSQENNNKVQKEIILLKQIDSIKKIQNIPAKVKYYNIGKNYYDLFANEFDWYGGYDYETEKAKKWFFKAIEYLETSAKEKYTDAYILLGTIYENTPDYNNDIYNYNDTRKAIYWLEKAINQKDISNDKDNYIYLLKYLARVYHSSYRGDKNLKNNSKAFELYKKAALLNDYEAQNTVGDMYYRGDGVSKDYYKAFYWFKKSAENGYAYNDLAFMYYNGYGTKKNYKKAYEWFNKSIKSSGYKIGDNDRHKGNSFACYYIGLMYYFGEYVQKDLKKSFWWIETSAINGDVDACSTLGCMYYFGQGTLKNKKLAFKWLQYADKNNDDIAQYLLGIIYYYGEITSFDLKKSAYWMKKSYKNGNEKAKIFWDEKELWKFE